MSEPLLVACSVCSTKNRVPREKLALGLRPVCGKCRSPLSIASGPLVVTDATFADAVERSPLPVVVDMWAPWCGPCRAIAPVIDQLASEMAGRVLFAKVNVDENPRTAGRFSIASIPALLVFKGGSEVDRIIGAQPKAEIARRVQIATA